eukprot:gene26996-35701_t
MRQILTVFARQITDLLKIFTEVGNYITHFLIAFLNPFDSLGENYASINIFSGNATIPYSHFSISNVGTPIDFEYKRINISWRIREGFAIVASVTNPSIVVRTNEIKRANNVSHVNVSTTAATTTPSSPQLIRLSDIFGYLTRIFPTVLIPRIHVQVVGITLVDQDQLIRLSIDSINMFGDLLPRKMQIDVQGVNLSYSIIGPLRPIFSLSQLNAQCSMNTTELLIELSTQIGTIFICNEAASMNALISLMFNLIRSRFGDQNIQDQMIVQKSRWDSLVSRLEDIDESILEFEGVHSEDDDNSLFYFPAVEYIDDLESTSTKQASFLQSFLKSLSFKFQLHVEAVNFTFPSSSAGRQFVEEISLVNLASEVNVSALSVDSPQRSFILSTSLQSIQSSGSFNNDVLGNIFEFKYDSTFSASENSVSENSLECNLQPLELSVSVESLASIVLTASAISKVLSLERRLRGASLTVLERKHRVNSRSRWRTCYFRSPLIKLTVTSLSGRTGSIPQQQCELSIVDLSISRTPLEGKAIEALLQMELEIKTILLRTCSDQQSPALLAIDNLLILDKQQPQTMILDMKCASYSTINDYFLRSGCGSVAKSNGGLSVAVDRVVCDVASNDVIALGSLIGYYAAAKELFENVLDLHYLSCALPSIDSAAYTIYNAGDNLLKTSTFDLKLVSMSLNTKEFQSSEKIVKARSYTVLDTYRVYCETIAVGKLLTSCQIFGEGTLCVSMKEQDDPLRRVHVLLSEERSLGSLFASKKKSSNMKPIFSMKALPSEVHWNSDSCIGVGVGAVYSNLLLNDITVSIDFQTVEPLCNTIQCFNIIREESFVFAWGSAPVPVQQSIVLNDSTEDDSIPLFIPSSPTSIMNIVCKNFKVTLHHHFTPVVEIRAKKLTVSKIVFGRHVQQTAISVDSFYLFELSAQYAVHTCIIGEYAMKSGGNYVKATAPEYLANRLDMHITSTSTSAFSLMEIQAYNMNILYVHRSIMTVVSFICDHLIPSFRRALLMPAGLLLAYSSSTPVTSSSTTTATRRGMFRLGASIHTSEVHLPASSCGSDAIVVIFDRCNLHKSCPIIEASNPTYCKGPLVSENTWLSDMSEAQTIIAEIFCESMQQRGSNSVSWKFPYAVERDLQTPSDVVEDGASVLKLDIAVMDTIICTWCSRNSVGERMTVRVEFTLQPIHNPAEPSMVRNTVSVAVSSDEVNWYLSQGQYLCIVNLIQQNFCELQAVVEDLFVPPKPATVDLTEHVYGKYCMDTSLPLLSTVPIRVKRGRIVILNNLLDYYELFSTNPANIGERQLDGQEGVWDSVPPCSCHFLYQDLLFSSKAVTNKEAPSSSQHTLKETCGEPILSINFENLFVDFFRRHGGGGNGIEVNAENFVLISAERAKTDMFSKTVPDINRLPTDAIVFAPRSLPSFHSKTNMSRQGNESGEGLNKANDAKLRSRDEDGVEQPRRHIRYTQQGIGNLRRCIVDIENSVAVAHMATIPAVVNFFFDPIKQISEKNLAVLAHNGLGPFDFKAALDVEVHVTDCLTCLPNCSPSEGVNGLCAAINLHYQHAWRGFLLCGPGKVTATVNADVKHIFVAPLHELYNDQIQPLVDRFTVSYENQLLVLPTESTRDRNIQLLSPSVNLSFWISRQGRKVDSPNAVQDITIALKPFESMDDQGVGSKDPFVYDYGNSGEGADKPCLPLRFSLKDVEFIIAIIEQLNSSLAKVLSNTISTNKLLKTWRTEHLSQFWDIGHIPQLTYYLVHVPNTLTAVVDREIHIDLSDLEATLRNNTYNLNILKLKTSNVVLSYRDSAGNLSIVAGLSCSCWAYNERHESWEPVIEPILMTAIGATDSTRNFQATDAATDSPAAAAVSTNNPSTLQIRVSTEPLDINLAQLTVVDVANKIMLPDVVTTSSIFLPPYKVVNMLGQEVSFNIGMDGWMVTSNEIGAGKTLPIEVHQLTEALESFKRKKKYGGSSYIDRNQSSAGPQQYLIEISFKNLKDRYNSKTPVPIDKEGIFPFHMQLMEEGKSVQPLETSSQEAHVEVSSQPIKFLQEIPLTLLDMRIKDDGVREILLRSIFAIRNHTKRAFYLSLKLFGSSTEYFLLPGREWYIPVRFANPKAALFFRMDENSEWSEALSSLQSLIAQGAWGAPTKLRAELSACSCLSNSVKILSPMKGIAESSNADPPFTTNPGVVVLLKPEARYPSKSLSGTNGDNYVSVRYPTKEIHRTGVVQGDRADNFEANSQTGVSFRSRLVEKAQPLYLHILSPIQLLNLLPQSIIYRIADGDDEVISEGILLPGEMVDVYNLSKLFSTRIFISIRMLNFCWSKWVQLLSKTSPFSTAEKQQDISLCSMDFHAGAGKGSFNIPAIDITMSMKENVVKFTCPLVISNCTGLQVELCEPSNHDAFISHCSQTRIETLIPVQDTDKSARKLVNPVKIDYFSRSHNYNLEVSDTESDGDGQTATSTLTTEQSESAVGFMGKESSIRLQSGSALSNNIGNKGRATRRLINLIIHSPSDHLQSFEIQASEDWTLHDVFKELKPKLALSADNQQASKYLFFPWREENISLKRKVKHSISPEVDNETPLSVVTSGTSAATDPPPDKKGKPESRWGIIRSAVVKDVAEVPVHMQMDMVSDWSVPHCNMSTKVSDLQYRRLRLSHEDEWTIFKQVESIKGESQEKDSIFGSIFNKKKHSFYCDYIQIVGDFPFRPHRMLGLSPLLSIRVADETDWSDTLDLLKSDFDSNEVTIALPSAIGQQHNSGARQRSDVLYEFGISLERGKGVLQNTTSVAIVPKHIVISKLSFPIEIRQMYCEGDDDYNKVIYPGSIQCFYYARKSKKKLLQVRRYKSEYGEDDGEAISQERWRGEVDISNLGFVFAKLRDPFLVIKVSVEIIGASWVATFSEQSTIWPPYRIVNRTSFDIRFRQDVETIGGADYLSNINNVSAMITPNLNSASGLTNKALKRSSTTLTPVDLDAEIPPPDVITDNSGREEVFINVESPFRDLEWDTVSSQNFCPFSWDHPFSCNKILKLELMITSLPTLTEIKLDDESKGNTVKLRRRAPVLGNPLGEGHLMRQEPGSDIWVQVYCILMPDVLYIFQDETRVTLVDIIAFSAFSEGETQFAIISRYEEKSWDIMNSLQSSMRFFGSFEAFSLRRNTPENKKIGYAQTNYIRRTILRLAESIGILSNIETAKQSGDGELPGVEENASGDTPENNLQRLLRAKLGVEQLLEEATSRPVTVAEVVNALISINAAADIDGANHICAWLINESYLMPRNHRSKAIDERFMERNLQDDDVTVGDDNSYFNYDAEYDIKTLDSNMDGSTQSLEAMEGSALPVSSKSTAKLTSHEAVLAMHESKDLYFQPPTLFPELAAQFSSANADKSEKRGQNHFGFTISIDNTEHNFKCVTEVEFCGWIQACRVSVEKSWVEYELGNKGKGEKNVSIKDYESYATFRVRPDGPTKVLEICEIQEDDDNHSDPTASTSGAYPAGINSSSKVNDSTMKRQKSSKKTISNMLKSKVLETFNSTTVNDNANNTPIVFVSFSVPLVAISLMDSEPLELFYVSLHEIEMTVERFVDTVRFSGIITDIHISNQLLRPEFPVALFPRRPKKGANQGNTTATPAASPPDPSNWKIADFESSDTFPSLQLQLQQKYHSENNSLAAFAQEANLHYFDVFNLWIAPFQLDVDEEFLVRCYRYYQAIKSVLNFSGKNSLSRDTKKREVSFEDFLPPNILQSFTEFLSSTKSPYMTYSLQTKRVSSIYFNILQLHPIDIAISFRPSQDLQVTNYEMAIISIISQLDTARLCLNALFAENAFGTSTMMSDILIKHYRASFWRQFHKLIGSADIVEGSVGLVANLGTGVYDLFYEPLEGLMDENSSFLNGLSKGAVSLSSRAIGGTSAFTSKLAGGIGKGVSMLTLDSQFQRNRTYRRYNKSTTVSEGLYMGTKELGKNIVEGVTGIVVSPYRGWETGGSVGFGMGVAKGLLGVALKPAVGVLDLASRATEGIRNSAFSGGVDGSQGEDRFGIHRYRIPRAFGRQKAVQVYDESAAAAQYLADMLTAFKSDPRLSVVHHMHTIRKVARPSVCNTLFMQFGSASSLQSDEGEEEIKYSVLEAWGYSVQNSYIVLICPDRLVLAQILPQGGDVLYGRTGSWSSSSSSSHTIANKKALGVRFIWSCPAECIDQLFSDPWGDLIITINTSLFVTGQWNSGYPVVLDEAAQDYVILQSLLEQTIGSKLARLHPLLPSSGYLKAGVLKRYSSGYKSLMFMAPTRHIYRIHGNVLYEYTPRRSNQRTDQFSGSQADATDAVVVRESAPRDSEEFIHAKILKLFDSPVHTLDSTVEGYSETCGLMSDNFLSFVYPLTAISVSGPTPEENGKQFSINITRNDGQKMRVLRREEERDRLSEYFKISLQLIFATSNDAEDFKDLLMKHSILEGKLTDVAPSAALTTEERKRTSRLSLMHMRSTGPADLLEASENSILSTLIIPTSGCSPEDTEKIKIEIGKTLSSIRR